MRLQNRLEGWWPLIDVTGTVDDYSKNNNNGDAQGGVIRDATGILGDTSYQFDTTDDVVALTDGSTGLRGSIVNSFTISGWLYRDNSSYNDGNIHTMFTNKTEDGDMQIDTFNGTIRGNSNDGGGISITTPYSSDTWYHVCLVYNGDNLILYVDGVQENIAVQSSIISQSFGSDIGGDTFDNNRYFGGRIQDVRFYSRGLPPAEVNALYERGRSASYSSIKKSP